MLKEALEFAGYKVAPRTTFAVRHPKAAVQLKKTGWDLRHARAPRITALGAAAIALPLGYVVGKIASRRSGHDDVDGIGPRHESLRVEPDAAAAPAPDMNVASADAQC